MSFFGSAVPTAIAQDLQQMAVPRLPVSNYIPPEGEEFRPHAYVGLPAIGTSAVVVQFIVPAGKNGIINRLANVYVGGGFQEGQGGVIWKLFSDFNVGNTGSGGIVIPNFDNIVASLGSVSNPAVLNGLRVKESNVVTLQVTNVSVVVAGQLIGGLLGGYFYPTDLEPPQMGF
jgi:hypothetical protein